MKPMTQSQIYKACVKNDYLLLRDAHTNRQVGHNARIGRLKRFEALRTGKVRTNYISYQSCTFQEYISYKTGILPSMNQ